MQSQCLSICSLSMMTMSQHIPRSHLNSLQTTHTISCNNNKPISYSSLFSYTHHFNPLRLSLNEQRLMGKQRGRRSGVVCFASSSALLSARNLHWVSAVCAGILMLVKGTAINRSYLVPLFALQAPSSIISWMQGEYGAWSAFLALLVRLFFSIPGELELPFMTLILVIVSPLRAMNLRGTQAGTIISLAIAAYLAFQHFTRAGSLQRAFHQESVVATLAIICITIVPLLLLVLFQ